MTRIPITIGFNNSMPPIGYLEYGESRTVEDVMDEFIRGTYSFAPAFYKDGAGTLKLESMSLIPSSQIMSVEERQKKIDEIEPSTYL